ncbi:MAG: HD domain-containing protein [Treponema sp.]|nr:HD domain-containing protein [Treponema sp.]
MKTEQMIDELYTLTENSCKSPNNVFGYGIWSHHIKPMVPLGQKLAKDYGGDSEIVTIAILLHDLVSIEDQKNYREHHIIGAERAAKLLNDYNYPIEKTERVKSCILNHRSSVNNQKNSIEEICVADADAIIHLTEVSSLFYAAYKEMNKTIEEGQNWIKSKLQKDYIKLSPGSKENYKAEFDNLIKLL